MTKVKSSNNIGIHYFYELYAKAKRKFPSSFFFNVETRKKSLEVNFPLFRNTITTYLDVYFKEFYKSDNPVYFPLSGEIMKVQGKGFYKQGKDSYIKSKPITWFWYLRPAYNYVTNVALHKLKGSTSKVYKLDNVYKENKDVALLPKVNEVLAFFNNQNKLHV